MGVGAGRLTLKENIYVRKDDQPGMADDKIGRIRKIHNENGVENATEAISAATISPKNEDKYEDVEIDGDGPILRIDDEIEEIEGNIGDMDGSIDNLCEIQVSIEVIRRIFETPSISQMTKRHMIDLCTEIYGKIQEEINRLEDLVDQEKLHIAELRKL